MNHKKVLFTIIILYAFFWQTAMAYNHVRLVINDGTSNTALKTKIEDAVSYLLTEINRAQENGLSNLPALNEQIAIEARQELNMLWRNDKFRCVEEEIVEHLITTRDGYQVRGIPLILEATADGELHHQEAVINFDCEGVITSFYYTINPELYSKKMEGVLKNRRNEVSDIEERMMILNYVEHFRTAYNQKDIDFLEQVYNDDALIITGRVIRGQRSDMSPTGISVRYTRQTKRQYLNNLRRAFRANRYIKVSFDDVVIVEHPTIQGIYGVTVHQKWNSSNYSDEGYVFMVWDFRNPDAPQIHVRTWQPEYIDKAHGQRLNPNDVFTLGDFDL